MFIWKARVTSLGIFLAAIAAVAQQKPVYNPAHAAQHPVYNPANPNNPQSKPATNNGKPYNPATPGAVAPAGQNAGKNNVKPPFCNDANLGRPVPANYGKPCQPVPGGH